MRIKCSCALFGCEAIEDFQHILDADSINHRYDIYSQKGYANHLNGDFKEAINDFSIVLNHKPVDWIYFHRALCYHEIEEIENCCSDFSKAVELGYEPAIRDLKDFCP